MFSQITSVSGSGKYVPNPAYSPYVYERIRAAAAAREKLEVKVERSEEDMFVDFSKCSMPADPNQEPEEAPAPKDELPPPPQQVTPPQPQAAAASSPRDDPGTRSGKSAIDAKPTIRVRAPPGGKSSIFF